MGDQRWTDYALSADVRIAGGDVELGGRFGDQNQLSYRWILAKDGTWKLNYQKKVLACGRDPGLRRCRLARHEDRLPRRRRSVATSTANGWPTCTTPHVPTAWPIWPAPTTAISSTT